MSQSEDSFLGKGQSGAEYKHVMGKDAPPVKQVVSPWALDLKRKQMELMAAEKERQRLDSVKDLPAWMQN